MRLVLMLGFSFAITFASGQKIDNTASYREMPSDRYFRLSYENDLFAGQDENYTQGFSFEFVAPFLSKNPINKIFFQLKEDKRKSGIVLEHIGFTPYDYESFEIQQDDRPFAAAFFLKSFSISLSEESKQRIATHFSFGIMGPAAQGKQIQTGIHRVTGGILPNGWKNQIENHFVLNYGVDYEKEFLCINNNFGLYANASAKIGNLYTNATLGFNSTFGLINNPYKNDSPKKFLLYAYIQPLVTFVGYDGTLQGSLIGDNSVYTIAESQMNRIVGQINYGIVLQTKHIYFECAGTSISKEIKTLMPAAWGGLKIGVRL